MITNGARVRVPDPRTLGLQPVQEYLARPTYYVHFRRTAPEMFHEIFGDWPVPYPFTPQRAYEDEVVSDPPPGADADRSISDWLKPKYRDIVHMLLQSNPLIDWYHSDCVVVPGSASIDAIDMQLTKLLDPRGDDLERMQLQGEVVEHIGWCGLQNGEGYAWMMQFRADYSERAARFAERCREIEAGVYRLLAARDAVRFV